MSTRKIESIMDSAQRFDVGESQKPLTLALSLWERARVRGF